MYLNDSIEYFFQCRLVAWRDLTKEIITANEDGNVTIWSAKDGHPMYVLAAHSNSAITQMLWLEDKQQLITCAKDKTVKIWSFPQVWYDEEEVKAKMGILPKKPAKVEPEE